MCPPPRFLKATKVVDGWDQSVCFKFLNDDNVGRVKEPGLNKSLDIIFPSPASACAL